MSIPGYATPEATAAYAAKFAASLPPAAYRRLPASEWTASRLGFGTYRCHADNPLHQEALKTAVENGCNLIDTSANYTDGNAELLVGEMLNAQTIYGDIRREQLIIVSKAGYVQGENMLIARAREAEENPFPEMVKYGQGLWHCIHPLFIEDQITRSLARMHLDTLDVYLLHNPEYFILNSLQQGASPEVFRAAFYDRLRKAFIQMEKLVKEGLIQSYGISSNSLPLPADHPQHVSLAAVWKAYGDACLQSGLTTDEGHFRMIQLPFNWLEHEAATLANNPHGQKMISVLALARELGLGVLSNRPLNAISDKRLLRLATYGADGSSDYASRLSQDIRALDAYEEKIREQVAAEQVDEPQENLRLSDHFRTAEVITELRGKISTVSDAREVVANFLYPRLAAGERAYLERLPEAQRASAETEFQSYRALYRKTCKSWLLQIDAGNLAHISPLVKTFDTRYRQEAAEMSLSQKALSVCLSADEIDGVLIGMRTSAYVADALGALRHDARTPVSSLR